MFSSNHNGVTSMDATLHTNDMKFYLFTLMMFNAHHVGVGGLDYHKSTNM